MGTALELLTKLHDQRDQLAKHTAGEVALLLGKTLKAMGQKR